jgi:hypothetical protein
MASPVEKSARYCGLGFSIPLTHSFPRLKGFFSTAQAFLQRACRDFGGLYVVV